MAPDLGYRWPVKFQSANQEQEYIQLSHVLRKYLSTLSEKTPDSTYMSEKQVLMTFSDWVPLDAAALECLERLGVNFLEYMWKNTTQTADTIHGYIHTLSNFIAYIRQDCPGLTATRVQHILHKKSNIEVDGLDKQTGEITILDKQTSDKFHQIIEGLIPYLRQRCFGSRTHAFVEVILDSKARPCLVRQTDLSDFDPSQNELHIGISDQFLLGKYNIVTAREVNLSSTTCEALSDYIEYDRTPSSTNDSEPVFTTSHGRASSSTLRRSLRQVNKKLTSDTSTEIVNNNAEADSNSTKQNDTAVRPSDIWQYAHWNTIQQRDE